MRIDNSSGEIVVGKGGSGRIESTDPNAGSASGARFNVRGSDLVNLSGAASLLSIARKLAPENRQSKLDAIAAQLRSGDYRADTPGVSRAVVRGHLQQ